MTNKKVRISFLVLAIISLILPSFQSLAAKDDFNVQASAAFAIDFETGKILYNQNGDETLAIASMTKLITAYIVYDEIEKGNLSWEQEVPISDKLKEMSQDPDLSNVPINDNQTFTVKDALYGSLISSANSLTAALAELISGTEIKFVDRMYQQLEDWGIDDAFLVSSSGLGNEDLGAELYPGTDEDDENMLSAKSMVIVARHLIEDFPEVLDITSLPSANILQNTDEETTVWSSNDMLEGFTYYKEGVDGLKTGTTPLAGACFIGTITKDGHRIITVVMNVDEPLSRFEETANLMDYVFETWSYETVAAKDEAAEQKKIGISNGKEDSVKLVLADDLNIWTKEDSVLKRSVTINEKELNKYQRIAAPKSAGNIIGQEVITDQNDGLGYLDTDVNGSSVEVAIKDSIKKENFILNMWHSIFPKR